MNTFYKLKFGRIARRSSTALLSMLGFGALTLFAQFSSGVQGTVKDSTGAVVPNARVSITNNATGVSQDTATSAAGLYFYNNIAPGSYTVTVTAPGFQITKAQAQFTTDQRAAVDVTLAPGADSTVVNVVAESAVGLNTDETRLQYTLSAREITQLPLENRATLALVNTAPGVTGVNENQTNVQSNLSQPSVGANGRTSSSNLYLLDNVPLTSELGNFDSNGNGIFGAISIVPNAEMIAEAALQTTTFSVENTAGSSLVTSLTSKSGGNQFHGAADYTYTGRPFAAVGDFSANTPFRRQFVSGALGGPVWKDHTFFFGTYYNQQVAAPSQGLVQDETDDFVNWALQNYPNSQNVKLGLARFRPTRVTNRTILQTGADIDKTNCDTPGYLPCGLPAVQQGVLGASGALNGTQYNFRLDHALRDGKDKIYLGFLRFDQLSDSLSERPGFDGVTPSTGYYIAASEIHTFSSRLLNQASFGATRYAFDFTSTPHSRDQVTVPYLNLVGGSFPGVIPKFLYSFKEHDYYGRDNVTYVAGPHNITVGFTGQYVNEIDDKTNAYARPFLQLPFNGYQGFVRDHSDLEQIYTLSAQTGLFVPQKYGAQTTRYSIYAQDAWKIRPNLLLNFGLRWDDYGNPTVYGAGSQPFANVFLGDGSTLEQKIANASSRLTQGVFAGRQNGNFLPRGSFAWTPTANAKLSIHGGVGLYEDDVNLDQITQNLPTQPPARLSLQLTNSGGPAPLVSYGTQSTQAPYGFNFPAIPGAGNFTPKGGVPGSPSDEYGEDRALTPQKALLYNFGLDQQIGRSLVFGLLYTGSHSYDQYVTTDLNTYNGRTAAGARPNTDFGQISTLRNAGYGNYNALIATIRDRVGGLDFQASYTWAHSLSTPVNYFTDQYNLGPQYANAAGDIRNRFTLSEVYEVPRLLNSRIWNEILGGFSLSNIVVAQSGAPFTVADANGSKAPADDFNQDGVNGGIDIPNYNGTRRGGWSRTEYKNGVFGTTGAQVNALFTPPTPGPGVEGNAGINSFRGPNYFDMDTGLSKRITLPWIHEEHCTLQLRGEAINILNRANLFVGGPIASGNLNATTYQVGNPNTNLGQAQTAGQGRIIQIGGRFEF